MVMVTRLGLLGVIVVALPGCAVPPTVASASSKSGFADAVFKGETVEVAAPSPGLESFRLFEQGATGFVPLSGVMEDVEATAEKFCEKRGANLQVLRWHRSVPPHVLGNFPRAELVFECHAQPSKSGGSGGASSSQQDRLSQLERLKRLLDSGAITQSEYDVEKARILKQPG